MSGRYPEREDTREFADRIWSIEKQVEERIQKVRSFYEQTMDERMRQTKGIEVGKRAWLSAHGITMPWDRNRTSKKLRAKYYGPFEVIEQTSPVTFKLQLPDTVNIHPIFHVGLLKAAIDGKEYPHQPLPSQSDDGEYEVEKIVSHKKRKDGKTVYLVKWQGYSYEECTWEPAKHFQPKTLQAYHAARKEAKANETDSSSEDEEDHVLAAVGTKTLNPHRGAAESVGTQGRDQHTTHARTRGPSLDHDIESTRASATSMMAIDSSRPNEQVDLLSLADSAPQEPMEGNRSRGGSAHRELSTRGPARKNHTAYAMAVDEQFI